MVGIRTGDMPARNVVNGREAKVLTLGKVPIAVLKTFQTARSRPTQARTLSTVSRPASSVCVGSTESALW